jgi:dienelactone hydrolase
MLLKDLHRFLALSRIANVDGIIINLPRGTYGVGSTTAELVNQKLLDPYAPTEQQRRTMISAYFPTVEAEYCSQKIVPYMPELTADTHNELYAAYGIPEGTFNAFEFSFCDSNTTSSSSGIPHLPVILFSPGLGDSRFLYGSIAASLAAEGFVVITIDHAYDAGVVEFSDGSLALEANITTVEDIEAALQVRTKDVSFVIDQLYNQTLLQALLVGVYGDLALDNIITVGHSLGGATASSAMLCDSRIRGGINIDGTFFGPIIDKGLHHPLMIFAHQGKNASTDNSWAEVWQRLHSAKLAIEVRGSQHGSFTDFPLLRDLLGFPIDAFAGWVGTIDGGRMLHIMVSYISSWVNFVTGQPAAGLLQGPDKRFPEVQFLGSRAVNLLKNRKGEMCFTAPNIPDPEELQHKN